MQNFILPLRLAPQRILGARTTLDVAGTSTPRRGGGSVDEAAICILKEVFCYNGSFLRSPSYRVLFGVKKESDKLTQCRNFNARNATWRRATLCSERAAHAIRRSGLTLPGAIIGVTATAKVERTNERLRPADG